MPHSSIGRAAAGSHPDAWCAEALGWPTNVSRRVGPARILAGAGHVDALCASQHALCGPRFNMSNKVRQRPRRCLWRLGRPCHLVERGAWRRMHEVLRMHSLLGLKLLSSTPVTSAVGFAPVFVAPRGHHCWANPQSRGVSWAHLLRLRPLVASRLHARISCPWESGGGGQVTSHTQPPPPASHSGGASLGRHSGAIFRVDIGAWACLILGSGCMLRHARVVRMRQQSSQHEHVLSLTPENLHCLSCSRDIHVSFLPACATCLLVAMVCLCITISVACDAQCVRSHYPQQLAATTAVHLKISVLEKLYPLDMWVVHQLT